jgi:hypothetical protein
MSTYTKYKVYLTPNQQDKVKLAFKNGKNCSQRIEPKAGNTDLMLTNSQINHIIQNKKQNKGAEINLSKTQLEKSGGFLPLLLGLASAAAPFLARTAATGALGYAGNKIAQKVMGKEIKKPKKVGKQGSGIRLPGKKGTGIYLSGKEPKRY